MLLQRVLTALVLLPLAVAAILFLPVAKLAAVFAGVGVLAAWEWSRLSGLAQPGARLLYTVVLAVILFVISDCRSAESGPALFMQRSVISAEVWDGLLGVTMLWWLWAFTWILRYPRGFSPQRPSTALRLALGVLVIPAAIVGLVDVRARLGIGGLLTVFVLVWAADIAAYFTGRSFGRHKLAPGVSPGKTWEGFAGGLAGALVGGATAALYVLPAPRPWPGWLVLCAAVAAISVVGDLTESLLKRQVGTKDSGSLLPGHGGVLDRIDSLLAAAPAMALGLRILGL
jgi:phosphatidate cytidylyltransferase